MNIFFVRIAQSGNGIKGFHLFGNEDIPPTPMNGTSALSEKFLEK